MALSYQKKGITLPYKEGKPVVYKAKQVAMPKIKSAALLAYAANADNIPVSNIESCVEGLIEAIAYFVINGHRVVLPEVGGFYLGVKSKAFELSENLNVKQAVQAVCPLFAPATELREQMNDAAVEAIRPSNGTEDAPITGGSSTPSGGGESNTGGNTGGNNGSNTGGNTGGNNGDDDVIPGSGGGENTGGNGTLVDDPDGD